MIGLDYNTERSHLILPQYGRIVQEMVEKAMEIDDRQQRNSAAEKIVKTMATMATPEESRNGEFYHRLWNHLAIISDFKLDIDYPYNVAEAKAIIEEPQPIKYPDKRVPVRHYGKHIHNVCEILSTMPEGPEREELARDTANQMRRMLLEYGNSNAREENVIHDIERFTDGKIKLNPQTFRFDKTIIRMEKLTAKKRKRRHKK